MIHNFQSRLSVYTQRFSLHEVWAECFMSGFYNCQQSTIDFQVGVKNIHQNQTGPDADHKTRIKVVDRSNICISCERGPDCTPLTSYKIQKTESDRISLVRAVQNSLSKRQPVMNKAVHTSVQFNVHSIVLRIKAYSFFPAQTQGRSESKSSEIREKSKSTQNIFK